MHYFKNLFRGRINRKTFILGTLFIYFVYIVLPILLLVLIIGITDQKIASWIALTTYMILAIPFGLYTISLTIRRLHDMNKSIVWVLLGIIPYAGFFILNAYLALGRADAETNRFGEPPKNTDDTLKEVFNPEYIHSIQDDLVDQAKKESIPGLPINLSSNIVVKFGYMQIKENLVVIAVNDTDLINIARSDINEIQIRRWMIFNFKIKIIYTKNNTREELEFATGDKFSTNILKTAYLYNILKEYKSTGKYNLNELAKVSLIDRLPIIATIVSAYGFPFIITTIYGIKGIEYIVLEFLVGLLILPYSLMLLYTLKAKSILVK